MLFRKRKCFFRLKIKQNSKTTQTNTMADREDRVYMAKLAEQAERYDEMLESMKSVATYDTELTVEERNLLSVAYKNVIGARRASWRIISSIEAKEEGTNENQVRTYRIQVNNKLCLFFSSIEGPNKYCYLLPLD